MNTGRSLVRCSLIAGALAMAGLAADTGSACAIPVFRYALERWVPGVFEAVVLHRGPLSDADQQCIDRLRAAQGDQARPANLRVITVDLEQAAQAASPPAEPSPSDPAAPAADARPEGDLAIPPEISARYGDLKTPQLLLHFPVFGPQRWLAWSGPLTAENVQRVVDSPLRQQVIQRVLAGDSAVWVLIDSGDSQKDDEADKLFRAELARLEQSLKLPPRELMEAEAEFQADTQVELRIGFSLLRLRRDDPNEQVFLSMLLNSEPDLAEFTEPIAIPIFGRGRTFFALVGKGITAENIADNCQFVCGECSCQVKEQNPGMDLLMAVNWDQHVTGSAFPDVVLPELTGIGGLEAVAQQSQPAGASTETAPPAAAMPAQTPIDAASSSAGEGNTPDAAGGPLLARADHTTVAPADASGTLGSDRSPAPLPQATTVIDEGQFGGRLLIWTIGGAALAVLVIAGGSLRMRRQQRNNSV